MLRCNRIIKPEAFGIFLEAFLTGARGPKGLQAVDVVKI
jgi:hypothetical protein